MKHCVTPSRPDPSLGRRLLVRTGAVLFGVLPLIGGCVTSGTHNALVQKLDKLSAENERQAARITALETSNQALSEELGISLEEYEDLSVEHEASVGELGTLRESEDQLSASLAQQSLELARSQEELETATAEVDKLTSTYTALMSDLEAEVTAGEIQIEHLKEGIRVNVSQDILFASGSAKLDPVGAEVLGKVANQLKRTNHQIEVQGHTDDRGISGALAQRYPTNWELASARASRVVRLMQDLGVPGEQLKVTSFASFQPVAPNETAEDRALNRRIEIRLKPQEKPDAAAAPAKVGG
ncbi:MAG: OmpA family protein [Deltaproteobacteria bacterium]|nr:OmpA family protein [Deltaproteobacteria bacterium]